jgi:hypothetical protein
MSKKQILILLGAWVMLFTFLGFPEYWDKIISLVTGCVVIIVAYLLPSPEQEKFTANLPFVEYKNSAQENNKDQQI